MKINRYDYTFVSIEGKVSEHNAMSAWIDRAANIVHGLVVNTVHNGEDGTVCLILVFSNNRKQYTKAEIISALTKTKKY